MPVIHNDVIDTILARRSVRAFQRVRQLTEDELETLLACGFAAPSGMNCQSWHLCVVQDKSLLQEISDGFVRMVKDRPNLPPIMVERLKNPDYQVFFHAPTDILVCCETSRGPTNAAHLAENIVLAAQSLGLATCFIGGVLDYLRSPDGAPFLARLGIPAGYEPMYFLSVGVPAESPDARPRDTTKFTLVR
jgi:nitroreductase